MIFSATPANWTNASSDANFRAWGKYISDQLTAVGITKTADTGQIDWTTVSNPGGTNTYPGYEIRQFTDALQVAAPVFIKIEYGEGGTTDAPSVRMQFGSGSNGSGTLTGNLSTRFYAVCSSVSGACLALGSGDSARFSIIGGFTAAGGFGQFFGFERSKNAAGQDTTEAVLICASNDNGAVGGTTNARIYAVWSTTLGNIGLTTAHSAPALFPPGSTATSGSQTVVSPILHYKGIFMNPGLNFVGYYTQSITPNGTVAPYIYGVQHTYYALPATSAISGAGWQGAGSGTEATLIRYE